MLFRSVIRHLTVLQDEAATAPSVMMKMVEREDSRKSSPPPERGDRGDRADRGDRPERQERPPQEASA